MSSNSLCSHFSLCILMAWFTYVWFNLSMEFECALNLNVSPYLFYPSTVPTHSFVHVWPPQNFKMVPALSDTCNFVFRFISKIAKSEVWKATSAFGLFFCFFQNYMVLFWSSVKDVYATLLEHDSPCVTVFPLPGMAPHFCTWWQLLEIYGRQWFFSVDSIMSISRWEEPYWISSGSNARPLPSSQIVMK